MVRPYGSSAQRRSRPSVQRDSLFNNRESQTFDTNNPGYPDLTEYLEREGIIADKLPTLEEETEEPETTDSSRINLAYFARPQDIVTDDKGVPRITVDFAFNGLGDEVTRSVPVTQWQNLTVTEFVKEVQNSPELVHALLYTMQVDHEKLLEVFQILQQANNLNKEKIEHMATQHQASGAKLAELEGLLKKDPDTRFKDLTVQLEKYKGWVAELKEDVVAAQTENQEAGAFTQEDLDELNKSYSEQIADLQKQVNDLKKKGTDKRTPSEEDMDRFRKRNQQRKQRQGGNPDPNPSDHSDSETDSDTEPRGRRGQPKVKKSQKGSRKEDSIVIPDDSTVASDDTGLVMYDATLIANMKELARGLTVKLFKNDKELSHAQWQSQVENKLDNTVFKDTGSALRSIHNWTGGDVFDQLEPMVPTKLQGEEVAADAFKSVREMLKYINEHYGIRDKAGKAHNEWHNLKMGETEKFTTFYRKYQAARAHVRLDTQTEIYMFQNKLSDKFQDRFVGEYPDSMQSLVQKCYKIESDLDRMGSKSKKDDKKDDKKDGNKKGGRGQGNKPDDNANPKLPWESRPAAFKNLPANTKAHRTKLMKEGKCHKCQQQGHVKNDEACPLFAYGMPKNVDEDQKKANASSSNINTEAGTDQGNA